MIRILLPLLIVCFSFLLSAQKSAPEFALEKEVFETHLRYLASDEMAGRYTASEGGEKAANYLARLFEIYGLKPISEESGYFQKIPFDKVKPPTASVMKLGGNEFIQGDNMVVFGGKEISVETEAVYVGHGWVDEGNGYDDYKEVDVKGKIVFTKPGTPDNQNPFEIFKVGAKKRAIAKQKGAIGVVELFRMKFPWRFFKNYFNKERLEVTDLENEWANDVFYAFIKEGAPNPVKEMEEGTSIKITVNHSGIESKRVSASNVVGILGGSDPALKDEYIVVSAHYDHVGVGSQGGGATTPQDSIFNGSRDNAMGIVAMLASIKAMAQDPPKRSIVYLACTGEEMGMIGSAFYAENPVVPLSQTVFNLNNDGGGYNTTENFSVIGFTRTNVQPELEKVAATFDLGISKDPAPEQNLYERSDNISFAKKGIPAIDFAPGITGMDEAIYKYYHQVTDNPETIDYDYLIKFCRAFAHATRLIADKEEIPYWTPGDKFEKYRSP